MRNGILRLFSGALLATAVTCANAQVITTVAGTDFTFPHTPIPAINAPTGSIFSVAVDASGSVFFSDYGNNRLFKADPKGAVTVVAGNGAYGPVGDGNYGVTGDGGPATSAALCFPGGIALDATGNLFIADQCNSRIRKVTPNGIITTVAGSGEGNASFGYSGDGGPATNAMLNYPTGVAVDTAGNLFIADLFNSRIRKVTSDGIISTVAGNGTAGESGDGGPATSAMLNGPNSVAVDAAGNLFIADNAGSTIRKVTPAGIISTVAGNGINGYFGDGGPATSAALCSPGGVAVDATGNLFWAEFCSHVIRKVTPAGIISTIAGNSTRPGFAGGYSGDGGPPPARS